MVVVPKSTMHNWCNEFRRFCPCIKVVKFHGNQEEREAQKRDLIQPGKFDVMITSYEMIIKEKGHFKKFVWRYIIIDEAHRIKNENSTLSKTVRLFRTNYRLLITGTPLQNNLHELWALLNFLLPEVFASAEKFEEWFSLGDGGKEKEAEVVQQLHKVLRPFLLRRVKSDVERGLPPKKETILKIGMSEMQRKWYAALLQKDLESLSGGGDRSKLLNVVMQLRKCCNHPYLFQGAEPGPPFFTGEHLVENSGKLVLLDKLLPKLKARGSRVLIFSQMTRALDILEDYALYRGFKYSRIDGNTSGDDRENAIDSYNCENSEKFLFLLSTRAGGLGINLATADIVVLYDSDWNPQMDLQAMDRAHRIGQKKEVQVFRLCIENSIEEKVIEKAYKKLRLDALVIQQGRLTDNSQNKVRGLRKGSKGKSLSSMSAMRLDTLVSRQGCLLGEVPEQDIDAILERGEAETRALNEKMKQFTENAKSFALDGGIANVYDYKDEEENQKDLDLKHLAAHHWVEPTKRERKNRINYSENEFFKAGIKGGKAGGPRLPKMPQLQDFQFYDTARLTQLFEKEHTHELFKMQQAEREKTLKSQGASEEAIQQALAPNPEDPAPLTEEEQAEKEQLLSQGFSNWTRKDFNSFVRVCEKYGRDNVAQIATEIEGKTEEEVREYSKVFWARYKELSDWEKVIKNIERGEQKIQRQADIQNAIANKLDKYKNPWQELKLVYGANKGKAYTEDEDRFILCMVHKLGYGNWDDLKAEVRKSWRFRFDWFFKSRTPQELARRCETLIRLIEKENEDAGEGGVKRAGRKPKDASAGGASAGPGDEGEMPAGKTSGRKKRPTQAAQQGQQQGSDGEGGSPAPAAKKARA
ncbi:P-loop containing nucleoside triphosphate hydrolase protein [Dunaliella salina]|uniref:P-loop containing nucleoside triphosphate hydrolase protein n=1 Tax=Dunaliella salina TaxID=3046 RepID=A0ABQ7H418_DUNSA|nr:P-loop containing nucleoside triphosphate hydrolase protein [Dunaliella salina]|eukprot:KAF5841595.1 P-loop containing nucleoside triphosphate hydrolase protein [Dunaliella salina]